MKALSIVVCFMCVNSFMASETYKAGVLSLQNKEISEFIPFIHNAGKTGIDILVLPLLEPTESTDNYDEVISVVSRASRQAGMYVVVHLYEKARCQLGYEMVRSNLVFDRKGAIVAVYRKPQNGVANCTTSESDLVTFTTDFGVTFGVLIEEDIVQYDEEDLKGVKNFVMTGDWQSEVPFLNAAQFASSWSYVTDANLVSTSGIYSGKAGLKAGAGKLAVAELHKNRENDTPVVPSVNPSTLSFPGEDLSQYVIKHLDLEASSKGYKDTVCHRSFCCEFYVKTGSTVAKPDASYRLAALNGIRPFSANQNIGTQICVLSGSEKSMPFERISVTANFTKQNSQYPIVQSTTVLPTDNFKFETNVNGIPHQVTLEIVDSQNVVNFGIFGKDATNKLENTYVFGEKNSTESAENETYDYIFSEDVQEFFDYVWIRIRILIVVVSIYILEMM